MSDGSRASSPASLSAGGHDEQPWLVNNSMTARGSADATADVKTAEATIASDNATERRFMPISTSSRPRRIPALPNYCAASRNPSDRGCLVPGKDIETTGITGHSIRGERAQPPAPSCREMAQHVLQDAAILEVVEFVKHIDAAEQRNALEGAVCCHDLGDQPLPRLQIAVQAADRDRLVALEAERLPRGAFLEHQWDHAHADQVGAVDALERLRDHGADAEQGRALGGPVARR